MQLGRIARGVSHIDAEAVGDAVADAGHADGVGLGRLTRIQPGTEVIQHPVVVFEPRTKAKAVVSRRIDKHSTLVTGIAHGRVILNTIGDRRHQTVVAGHDDAGGRRQVAAYSLVSRELAHKVGVFLSLLAQEVAARPFVRHALVHRDDGIEEDGEVRTYLEGGVCRDDRRQVTSCREAHDAYIVGIDAPDRCGVANDADALLYVADRLGTVALRQPVVHHEVGDAALVHPFGSHDALMAVRQDGISTARYTDNGSARGRRRQEAHHLCCTVIREVQSNNVLP